VQQARKGRNVLKTLEVRVLSSNMFFHEHGRIGSGFVFILLTLFTYIIKQRRRL